MTDEQTNTLSINSGPNKVFELLAVKVTADAEDIFLILKIIDLFI